MLCNVWRIGLRLNLFSLIIGFVSVTFKVVLVGDLRLFNLDYGYIFIIVVSLFVLMCMCMMYLSLHILFDLTYGSLVCSFACCSVVGWWGAVVRGVTFGGPGLRYVFLWLRDKGCVCVTVHLSVEE